MRILSTAVCLALLCGVVLAGGGEGAPSGRPPAVPVRAAKVEVRAVQAGRRFVGTVEPARRTVVGTEFAGLVTEFLAREGDHVEQGQVLARLRTRMLDLRIEVAQARLGLARERLRELENGSRPEEIVQAKARLEQFQAEVALRKWQMEASDRLYKDRTISEDDRREAELAYEAALRSLEAQQAAVDLVEAGPREERIAQAKAEIAIQEAEIAELQEERDRYAIRAPFAGFVVREATEVGQWLAIGSPVAEIIFLDEVDVVVQVAEDYLPALLVGEDVRVSLDALPGRIFTAPIHRIVPQADLRGRTFPVRIRLANLDDEGRPMLRAGMFAQATLAVGQEEKGLFVPKDAIVLGGSSPMVWAIDAEGGMARPVPVSLGIAVEDLVQVMGPVEAGASVVTRGNERLRPPAAAVTILPD
jgi:HlyD family secretion protein